MYPRPRPRPCPSACNFNKGIKCFLSRFVFHLLVLQINKKTHFDYLFKYFFFQSIGLTLEEAMKYFRMEFTKGMDNDAVSSNTQTLYLVGWLEE